MHYEHKLKNDLQNACIEMHSNILIYFKEIKRYYWRPFNKFFSFIFNAIEIAFITFTPIYLYTAIKKKPKK